MRIIILFSVLFAAAITAAEHESSELDLSRVNKAKLAEVLFDEIERLDANAIYVRNKTKDVKWPEFRAVMTKRVVQAESKKSLAAAIDAIQQGFTNSHASIQPYSVLFDIPSLYAEPPDKRGFNLGYTYPNIGFFSLKNNKWISDVNGTSLTKRFYNFEQYECEFAHQNACLDKFVKRIRFGWAGLDIQDEVKLQGVNGEVWSEFVISAKPDNKKNKDYCKDYAEEFPDWTLNFSGANLCLLTQGDLSLLRVYRFGDWGVSADDFNCYNKAEPGTYCNDIQRLSEHLAVKKQIRLVIDLQDNQGGAENTPLVSLLSQGEFKDNLVIYRASKEMQNEVFRDHVFYGSERAHKWYKSVESKQSPLASNGWTPARADFCRGSNECELLPIPRRSPNLDIKKIVVVVNSGCFSSCDDLVWRLKKYANAYVVGQPPVTDGTYVSVTGVIYLTPQGDIKSEVLGPSQRKEFPPNITKLLWFRVPYSSTLNDEHQNIEGDSTVVDEIIPITRDNFRNLSYLNVALAAKNI